MSQDDTTQTNTEDQNVQETSTEESQSFEDQLELDGAVEESENPSSDKNEQQEESTETEEPKPQDSTEAPAKEETEETDKSEEDDEAARKRHNYEMAQKRIAERDAQRRTIEQTIDRSYQPQPADQLVNAFMEQGYNQFEAEMLARDERRNQQSQIQEARTHIAEMNMQIETEAIQVMHDFPVFDPNSDKYDPEFAAKASLLYERAADVQVDPNSGVIVQSKITPYEFYKQLHDMRSSGVSQAQVKAQKAAEQQMAAVAPAQSTAPPSNLSKDDKEAKEMEDAFSQV